MQGTSGTSAFTGCDSVSAFAGIGKVRPLNLLRCKKEFQVMFQDLSDCSNQPDEESFPSQEDDDIDLLSDLD